MTREEEYAALRAKREQKAAVKAWEKPLSMPVAVPKPAGKKKKSRFDKKEISEDD